MKLRRVALAMFVSALTFASIACGGGSPRASDVPNTPATGAEVVADPARIVRLGRQGDFNPQHLDTIEVAADDQHVKVGFYGGNPGCFSIGRVEARFEPARVTLAVLGGAHSIPANQVCTEEARLYSLTIRLAEKVAGRPIG